MPEFTIAQIAQRLQGELIGPPEVAITSVEQIDQAGPGQITFIGDRNHGLRWPQSRAAATLLTRGLELPADPRPIILVANADLALAQVLEMFAPPPPVGGLAVDGLIHPLAVVDPTARLGPGVRVGAHCVIGPRTVISAGATIHANVTILDDCQVGRDCVLWPGTVIRERCILGDRCILHPNVTIGSDGFGYRPGGSGVVKIPHIGNVCLGNDVELGAAVCVDRGKFSSTTIGDGTKIDNLCQIAHNVRIGRCCLLAGQSGIAGSTVVGDGVIMGGRVAVRDHVTIGDGVRIAACASVMNDIPAGETWAGYPAQEARRSLREAVAVRKLPDLIKLLKLK